MHTAIEKILTHGERIKPSKGKALELTGVMLEITNPRARISRTETRGKPYSCLGELCWYLAKSNDLTFIGYYLSRYKKLAEGGKIFGGYGPRLSGWKEIHQLANVTKLLRKNSYSRKAVIQLFDCLDIKEKHKDVPCTCTLQFFARGGKLHMFTNMRSNDAYLGLPHDVFSFTMLQEIIARDLGLELGTYKHVVGSLHLYEKDKKAAKQFLNEGWQSTNVSMPSMPEGNPWPAIQILIDAEVAIRTTGIIDDNILNRVGPYWADLIRLLEVFRCKKHEKNGKKKIAELRGRMSSNIYYPFIDPLLHRAKRKTVKIKVRTSYRQTTALTRH